MGGKKPFLAKLDELFTTSSDIEGEHSSADISGLIGQYAHGNEPSHHIAYLYNYAGAPVHTIAFVDESSRPRMKELADLTRGEHRFVSLRDLGGGTLPPNPGTVGYRLRMLLSLAVHWCS